MDNILVRYVPKAKRSSIYDAWRDSDGYWITLKEGWHVESYSAERTIHEYNVAELRSVIKRITKDA